MRPGPRVQRGERLRDGGRDWGLSHPPPLLPRVQGGRDRPHHREVRGEPAHHQLLLRPRQLVHHRREGQCLDDLTSLKKGEIF